VQIDEIGRIPRFAAPNALLNGPMSSERAPGTAKKHRYFCFSSVSKQLGHRRFAAAAGTGAESIFLSSGTEHFLRNPRAAAEYGGFKNALGLRQSAPM
jgi:hypothetical protein